MIDLDKEYLDYINEMAELTSAQIIRTRESVKAGDVIEAPDARILDEDDWLDSELDRPFTEDDVAYEYEIEDELDYTAEVSFSD